MSDPYLHWPPGLRRIPGGKWVDDDGEPVTDPATLARVRALVIPPAWRYVWAALDPDQPIQARGLDSRGRVQYRYSAAHNEQAARHKFAGMLHFAGELPRLRAHVLTELRRRPAEPDGPQLTGLAVRLLDLGLFRVGTERYARGDHTYGLTTLLSSQVDVHGRRLDFDFVGKEHVQQQHSVVDTPAARIMKEQLGIREPEPTGPLFLTAGPDPHRIDSATVNSYIHAVSGAACSAKVFRTWGGTVIAAAMTGGARCAAARTHRDPALTAYDAVADILGNTPTVARGSYVHPAALTVGGSGPVRAAVAEAAERAGTDEVDRLFPDEGLQQAVREALADA